MPPGGGAPAISVDTFFFAGRSRPVHSEGQWLVGDVRGEPHGGGEPHRPIVMDQFKKLACR
ncbi:MAG: hypothetical protein Ct9H300mP32_6240 [Verrucomicrobiota bacterium]|nr:MAG: hypothetical protein Ct9H300mP32_6240 [Verrucomicrobiota bacterium]